MLIKNPSQQQGDYYLTNQPVSPSWHLKLTIANGILHAGQVVCCSLE